MALTLTAPPADLPAAVTCAENIALLLALHRVPTSPFVDAAEPCLSQKPQQPRTDGHDYILSFQQERYLTGALSFLASLTDNPDHVAAVCIQEDKKNKCLRLLLAVNKLGHDSGRPVLQKLKTGFENVLRPLAQVVCADGNDRAGATGEGASNTIEEDVFMAIVSMCENRILSRLRFTKTYMGVRKKPFKDVLQNAINSLKRPSAAGKECFDKGGSSIVEQMRAVIKLVDRWSSYQVLSRLTQLISGVYELQNMTGFCAAIRSISNFDMQPDSRANLLNIVSKVARYRHVARLLCHMARTEPLVRRWAAPIPVHLPLEAFSRTLPRSGYVPDISAIIRRTCGPESFSKKELDNIYAILGTDKERASEAFKEQAQSTRQKSKVHAEIQLLAYIEQHKTSNGSMSLNKGKTKGSLQSPPLLPPRVIRSNKDACFLCYTFIQLYSKSYYISRCHGRLYPSWRLPETLDAGVQQRFNDVLAEKIKVSINTLRARQTKISYPDPNESTLTGLPLLASASTLSVALSTTSSAVSLQGTPQEETQSGPEGVALPDQEAIQEDVVETDTTLETSLSSDPEIISVTVLETTVSACASSSHEPADEASIETLQNIKRENISQYEPASPAQTDSVQEHTQAATRALAPYTTSVKDGSTSLLCVTEPFEIQVEYATGGTAPKDGHTKKLSFSVDRLTAEEAERLRIERPTSIVDIEQVQPGHEMVDVALDEEMCLYVTAGSSVARIAFRFLAE